MHLADGGAQVLAGHRPADPPAGHRVRLGQPADRHRPVRHPGQRRDRDVPGAVVGDELVDLVGEGDQVVLGAERRDPRQFPLAEHLAARVLRAVHDDRPGAFVDGRPQLVLVERPVRLVEAHVAGHRSREDGVRPVVLVERLEDDDLLARVHHRQHRGDHGLGRAAGHREVPLGVHVHAVERPVAPGERVAQRLGAPGDRVLVDVPADGLDGGLLDLGGRREVREPLGEVHAAVLHREPGHLADHRLGELRRLPAAAAPRGHRLAHWPAALSGLPSSGYSRR